MLASAVHGISRTATRFSSLAAIFGTLATTSVAEASERRFTYVYEATTQPQGTLEYEQWVTWKTDKDIDSDFHRIDFRHEFEYGVTDRLQFAFYASDWRYQSGQSVDTGFEWRNVAFELIYNLTDPIEDVLGSALYGEVKVGDQLLALEGKLILQKNVGKWVFAWNGTLEAEWEGQDLDEAKGELAQTLGASYQFSPTILAGFELLHGVEYEHWEEWGEHAVYLGPNVAFRTESWWVTVTPLFQVTSVSSEPNYQVRLIFGFDF